MRFDELTQEERVKLLLKNSTKYLKTLGREELYALLDGMATLGPYKPEPKEEETWRRQLRQAQKG